MSEVVQWLDNWQTLISGVLAIVAAGGGSLLLYRQIAQTEHHEWLRRRNRFNAIRAVLPLTLSTIVSHAGRTIGELGNLLSTLRHTGDGPLPSSFSPPLPSADLVPSLQAAIEATEQSEVVALLSDIIGELQVLLARMDSLTDAEQMARATGVALNVEEYIVQAAKIHAMASALFAFARRETEQGPKVVQWTEAVTALTIANIREHGGFDGVYRIVERRMHTSSFLWQFRS